MKPIPLILVAIAIIVIAPFVYLPFVDTGDGTSPQAALPWQIEVTEDGGSQVFGLSLGQSTLGDAQAIHGKEMEIAIVTPKDGAGSLEGFNNDARAGFITGKMVLTAGLPAERIEAMRERAVKTAFMESTTRKSTLHPDDLAVALSTPLSAIAFIPTASLDAETIVQRFGEPAERLGGAEGLTHFLYPARGLGISLDSRGKAVLQYVAPRDFERLRAPLLSATEPAADAPAVTQ